MRKALEGMSHEERRELLTAMEREATTKRLDEIREMLDERRHSWWTDFGANIAGNAVWDSATWLARRLLKVL